MLTLSIIVKNEEKYLKECLDSVKGVVDEIVLVDTGSNDNTINIAKEFNAKILNYKWNNDFASARNFALENSSGDWILYLDADERLSGKSIKELKNLIRNQKQEAYHCIIKNIDEVGNRPSVMKYVRLFPNDKRIRFKGKIHEQIEQSLMENDFNILNSSIEIIHVGYSLPNEELKEKAKRNLLILIDEYNRNPSPYYAFHLGQTYGILNNSESAVFYFNKAVTGETLKGEYKSLAFRYLAVIKAEKQNWNEALELITKSLEYNYEQPTNLLVAAKIFFQLKDYDKSNRFCRDAFDINNNFLSGNENSFQAILLDVETIIYEGLNISIQSKDKKTFNYFFEKLKGSKNKKNIKTFELIDILLNKKSFNSFKGYIPEINENNLELILTLIEDYEGSSKIDFFRSLNQSFPENHAFLNRFGLVLYNLQMFNEAEEIFEKSFTLTKNPSAVFYLISTYLQNNKFIKIKSTIENAERTFSGQKEIVARMEKLRKKIYPRNKTI